MISRLKELQEAISLLWAGESCQGSVIFRILSILRRVLWKRLFYRLHAMSEALSLL